MRAILAAGLALAACSGGPAPEQRTETAREEPLARLVRAEPRLARALASRGAGDLLDLRAATEGTELRAGRLNAPLLRVRAPGAKWNAGDSAALAIGRALDPWELELGPSVVGVRSERGGLAFFDARGDALLFLHPPVALDAGDARRAARPEWRAGGCRDGRCGWVSFVVDAPIALSATVLEAVTWQQRSVATVPDARELHGLAYDTARNETVLFGGGLVGFGSLISVHADTWAWDGTSWKQKQPATVPAGRWGHGMAYDAQRAEIVLHGGDDGNAPLGDTWRYDGSTWIAAPSGPIPALAGHALAYDSSRARVVAYGGWGAGYGQQVYEWTGTAWVVPGGASGTPGTRVFFSLGYDGQQRVVLFGGHDDAIQVLGDTWRWDGASWAQLQGQPAPTARLGAAMAYDSHRGCAVLFGGGAADTSVLASDETWELDGAGWTLRTPYTSPGGRRYAAMAYDAQRRRAVLFGGGDDFALDDTWEYRRFGGTCTTTAECDGASCVDGACCASASCGSCSRCSPVSGACEPVTNADDDTCGGDDTCDANGECKPKNGQPCASGSECASGICVDGVCCDAACDGPCEACDGGSCTPVAGAPRHGSCPGSGPCASGCDGTSGACAFPAQGVDCGSSCAGSIWTEKSCDGAGVCVEHAAAECAGGLACASASACHESCQSADDCTSGRRCEAGACVGSGSCDEAECAPYRCAGSVCAASCQSADDCAPGHACTPEGACRVAAADDEPGGCGCRMASPRSTGPHAAWLLLLLVAVVRRRTLALALLALGCSAPAEPRKSAPAEPPGVLGAARQLARADAWLSGVLASDGGFVRDGEAYLAAGRRADRLVVRAAAGTVELRPGRRSRPLVTISRERTGRAELDRGHVVERIARGVDAIGSALDLAFEEQLLLAEPALHRFQWRLELRSDVARVERERTGALLFVDARGDGLLRVPVPYAIDSAGRRREAAHAWADGVLTVELDARELQPPLLLDPLFEVVTWQEVTPAASPSERWRHAMAHHTPSGESVLFSGDETLSDTWTYSATTKTWTQKATTGPSGRTDHALAYDGAGAIVLFGGDRFGAPLGDTWLWSGSAWSEATPAVSPPPRDRHGLATDGQHGVVLFAGYGNSNEIEDMWGFAAGSWTPLSPASVSTPGKLRGFSFVHDPARGFVVLFGGAFASVKYAETWEWEGATNKWWLRSTGTASEPSIRESATAAFDSKHGVSVLFGGQDHSYYLKDTWEWDGAWTQRTPVTVPAARSFAAMAYDAAADRIVLFGGYRNYALADTWHYRRMGNSCATSAECDGFACVDGVCCIEASCASCEACSATTGECEPLANVEDPDSCSGTESCDAAGECKLKNGRPCGDGAECVSGHCADGICCNRACQGACEACTGGSCTFVVGAARHGSCSGSGPCGGACDGTGAECVVPGHGVSCGSACSGATLTPMSCDGQGSCVPETPAACPAGLTCADAQACKTACSGDDDCTGGLRCEQGACVSFGACTDEVHAAVPGEAPVDCTPYRCLGGACRSGCQSVDDCAPGHACTPDRRCVPATAESSDDDGGCGCRTAPRRRPGVELLVLSMLLCAAELRRRRRRRSPAPRSAAARRSASRPGTTRSRPPRR